MKKKKIFYNFAITLIATGTLISHCQASTAYSVGSKWPQGVTKAGSDFTQNVLIAADTYGWLANYSSYYNNQADYNYIKSTRLGNSQIYFINGHGGPDHVETVYKNTNNYRTGISIYNNGVTSTDEYNQTWTFAGLNGRDMKNTKLITFVNCNSGRGDNNLMTKAVAQGAKASVGFRNEIFSRQESEWLKRYNSLLGNGWSIDYSIKAANTAYLGTSLQNFVVTAGDTSISLGTLKKSIRQTTEQTSLTDFANKESVPPSTMSEKEREKFSAPIEKNYVVLDIDKELEFDIINFNENNLEKIISNIKNYDNEFNIKNYKISHNVINTEKKYGTITFIYYIGAIETNKGYLVNIEDNKVESITLGGIKKQNIKNIEKVKAEALSKKISEFESNKKEKALLNTNEINLKSSKVLNKNNTINKLSLSDNTIAYTERYYYDFNESKLYYILDQSEKIDNTYIDGNRFKTEIE